MVLRARLSRAKPWAWVRGHQLEKGKLLLSGEVGSCRSVDRGLNHRLLPVSFNLACRHCISPPTPPPFTLNVAADANYPFNFVTRVVKDDRGALFSAYVAASMHNDYEDGAICLERLVGGSVVRFGWSIYSLKLEGMDEKGELNFYYAVVLHDPSAKKKKLMEWRRLDPKSFYLHHDDTIC